jgi:hypothetical protein
MQELSRVQGLGEKKLQEFGGLLLKAVQDFLKTHPRQFFAEDSFGPAPLKSGFKPATKYAR